MSRPKVSATVAAHKSLSSTHSWGEHALHNSNGAVENDTALSSSIRADRNLIRDKDGARVRYPRDERRGGRVQVARADQASELELLLLETTHIVNA